MSANVVFDSPEVVDHNVRALLEKLTTENFDSISSEIIQWANGSEDQKDGRTLLQTVHLVFENATKGTSSSEMYARLCRRIMGRINSKVRDEGIKDAEGKPIAGGQLFRKYLINRCQEAFESLGSADATKAVEEKDALHKSKRRGPALTRFLGELFKFQMLTERIMHACINKLLGDWHDPKEEQMESLCELMTTVGPILDAPRARAHMDVHFQRMKEVAQNPSISVRLWFMLQEVLQLRERKWVARDAVATPTRAGDLFHFRDAQTNPSSSMSAQEHRGNLSAISNILPC
ncbi:armadillo-type protein [Amanita rubescens]|nr:armadillo-type protein [Amanita rubescens]